MFTTYRVRNVHNCQSLHNRQSKCLQLTEKVMYTTDRVVGTTLQPSE